ncbi:hypothetical protein AVEN_18232-1 [Araneus ventricosus]|uniref:Uncharacterized protein n=1 Tax=Araneus ventricosus TaxID=182803 RepID=A0A4Y2AIP7_ARAVE|nr:hypothetical protein AVEN_18232-1 [Araneus ventricosus]
MLVVPAASRAANHDRQDFDADLVVVSTEVRKLVNVLVGQEAAAGEDRAHYRQIAGWNWQETAALPTALLRSLRLLTKQEDTAKDETCFTERKLPRVRIERTTVRLLVGGGMELPRCLLRYRGPGDL